MSVWRKLTVWDRPRSNTFAVKFKRKLSFISLDIICKIEMSKNLRIFMDSVSRIRRLKF